MSLSIFQLGCDTVDPNKTTQTQYDSIMASEELLKKGYAATKITIKGRLFDTEQNIVTEAKVSIQNKVAYSDAKGFFRVSGLSRYNALIKVEHAEYYTESRPVHLQVSLDKNIIEFGVLNLKLNSKKNVRMFFGGDTSFGRRMLDSSDSTPFDKMPLNDPLAPIQVDDPLPGSLQSFEHVRAVFDSPDFKVLNLESPVITDPTTAHPVKDYSFFTLPASLDALKIIGVDYVSLGNNHVYDYLESGVEQTLKYINEYQIPNSGLGRNTKEAFEPYVARVKQDDFSFISVNTISGDKHEINYVAKDNKGGAADGRLYDELSLKVEEALLKKQIPVVQYHTGDEYTYEPSPFAHGNMKKALDMGSAFVIAHHPHIAQGFEWYKGKFIAHSLGNFLLDQMRLETMLGVGAELDIENGEVVGATGVPLYLEDYRPRLISGNLNTNLINRLSEKSINAVVYEQGGRAQVLGPTETLLESERFVDLEVSIGASGHQIIDLREHLKEKEYLKAVETTLSLKVGRDILEYGDFEDYDIDNDRFELARWDVTSPDRFACHKAAYKGAMGACLIRRYSNKSATVLAFRNSVRVVGDALDDPNKDLSFVGYVKSENAGPIQIYAKYTSSKDGNSYGQEILYENNSGGDFGWKPIFTDMNMPVDESNEKKNPSVNARATRIFIKQSSPKEGAGLLMVDEMAVVSWERERLASRKIQAIINKPNPLQYLKAYGKEGVYKLKVKLAKAIGHK